MDWQDAFNAILTVAGCTISLLLRSVYKWNEQSHERIEKRIDGLEKQHEQSRAEAREFHESFQNKLPNMYITRLEHNSTIQFIKDALVEIRAEIRNLRKSD